jgi:hypothetical protein
VRLRTQESRFARKLGKFNHKLKPRNAVHLRRVPKGTLESSPPWFGRQQLKTTNISGRTQWWEGCQLLRRVPAGTAENDVTFISELRSTVCTTKKDSAVPAGLVVFSESHPALVRPSIFRGTGIFVGRIQCWATVTRPCRDSSQTYESSLENSRFST